jgi:hypothetical protein
MKAEIVNLVTKHNELPDMDSVLVTFPDSCPGLVVLLNPKTLMGTVVVSSGSHLHALGNYFQWSPFFCLLSPLQFIKLQNT